MNDLELIEKAEREAGPVCWTERTGAVSMVYGRWYPYDPRMVAMDFVEDDPPDEECFPYALKVVYPDGQVFSMTIEELRSVRKFRPVDVVKNEPRIPTTPSGVGTDNQQVGCIGQRVGGKDDA